MFADTHVSADGSIPEEESISGKSFILVFAEHGPSFLHTFTFLIKPKDHDVTGDEIHLSDSVKHIFILLSLAKFSIISQQPDVFLNSLTFDVM